MQLTRSGRTGMVSTTGPIATLSISLMVSRITAKASWPTLPSVRHYWLHLVVREQFGLAMKRSADGNRDVCGPGQRPTIASKTALRPWRRVIRQCWPSLNRNRLVAAWRPSDCLRGNWQVR
jgi:hypothetical protein